MSDCRSAAGAVSKRTVAGIPPTDIEGGLARSMIEAFDNGVRSNPPCVA